jgi:hypothetical protein
MINHLREGKKLLRTENEKLKHLIDVMIDNEEEEAHWTSIEGVRQGEN